MPKSVKTSRKGNCAFHSADMLGKEILIHSVKMFRKGCFSPLKCWTVSVPWGFLKVLLESVKVLGRTLFSPLWCWKRTVLAA